MQKQVDFENPIVKALLARHVGVKENQLKDVVMPQVGDTITLGNIIYRIDYVREKPFRFSASPAGVLLDEELQSIKALSDQGQLPNSPDQGKLS